MDPPPANVEAAKSGRPKNEPRDAPIVAGYESDSVGDFEHADTITGEETGDLSDDGRAGDLAFWIADDDWVFRSDRPRGSGTAHVVTRMPAREISVLRGILAGVVDESKYYITANSLTSILTVRWKHSDRGPNWDRFARSKPHIDAPCGGGVPLQLE